MKEVTPSVARKKRILIPLITKESVRLSPGIMGKILPLVLVGSTLWASPESAKKSQEITFQRRTAIVQAAERVSPSVVSISVLSRVVTQAPLFEDPFFGEFWRQFFPPRYLEREVQSLGSGIILSSDGYIVTNAHVVKGASQIQVTLTDGRTFDATLVGMADKLDIALLKVDAEDLPAAPLGNSDSLMIGEWVIAVGNPFGFLLEDLEPTVTVGVISALHRTMKGSSERIYRDMIQTDAAINPGNSGGPLVNALGEVIGMNTFIITKSGGSEGIGFAIPINTVRKIVRELKQYGEVREGYLGFRVQGLSPELREAMEYPYLFGVLVNGVDPDGPASGKIQEGDIIMAINHRKLYNVGDFEDITYALVPGEVLRLTLWREGMVKTLNLRSEEFHVPEVDIGFGLIVAPVTPAIVDRFGLTVTQGVMIVRLLPRSPFRALGLDQGDVILAVNDHPVRSPKDLKALLEASTPGYVKLIIDRKGQRFWITGVLRGRHE